VVGDRSQSRSQCNRKSSLRLQRTVHRARRLPFCSAAAPAAAATDLLLLSQPARAEFNRLTVAKKVAQVVASAVVAVAAAAVAAAKAEEERKKAAAEAERKEAEAVAKAAAEAEEETAWLA
jgi:RecA/RadA recombinase